MLRITISEGVKMKLYEMEGRAVPVDSKPVAISHAHLGNNVQELVGVKLKANTNYAILVLFAEDADDLEEKSEVECFEATMQVKIANSGSEFRCLHKGLDDWKAKLDKQADSFLLSYNKLEDKGKHILMTNSRKLPR